MESHLNKKELETEAACRQILEAARRRAALRGIFGEEADDCALDFLLHLLLRSHQFSEPAALFLSEAWLDQSADHWILDALRRRTRRFRTEVPWASLDIAEQDGVDLDTAADGNLPEHQALRSELATRLCGVVLLLTPIQRDLFLRCFLADETAAEIARESGKRAGTVRQAMTALRRRLQTLLRQAGMDENEAAEYLTLLRSRSREHRFRSYTDPLN